MKYCINRLRWTCNSFYALAHFLAVFKDFVMASNLPTFVLNPSETEEEGGDGEREETARLPFPLLWSLSGENCYDGLSLCHKSWDRNNRHMNKLTTMFLFKTLFDFEGCGDFINAYADECERCADAGDQPDYETDMSWNLLPIELQDIGMTKDQARILFKHADERFIQLKAGGFMKPSGKVSLAHQREIELFNNPPEKPALDELANEFKRIILDEMRKLHSKEEDCYAELAEIGRMNFTMTLAMMRKNHSVQTLDEVSKATAAKDIASGLYKLVPRRKASGQAGGSQGVDSSGDGQASAKAGKSKRRRRNRKGNKEKEAGAEDGAEVTEETPAPQSLPEYRKPPAYPKPLEAEQQGKDAPDSVHHGVDEEEQSEELSVDDSSITVEATASTGQDPVITLEDEPTEEELPQVDGPMESQNVPPKESENMPPKQQTEQTDEALQKSQKSEECTILSPSKQASAGPVDDDAVLRIPLEPVGVPDAMNIARGILTEIQSVRSDVLESAMRAEERLNIIEIQLCQFFGIPTNEYDTVNTSRTEAWEQLVRVGEARNDLSSLDLGSSVEQLVDPRIKAKSLEAATTDIPSSSENEVVVVEAVGTQKNDLKTFEQILDSKLTQGKKHSIGSPSKVVPPTSAKMDTQSAPEQGSAGASKQIKGKPEGQAAASKEGQAAASQATKSKEKFPQLSHTKGKQQKKPSQFTQKENAPKPTKKDAAGKSKAVDDQLYRQELKLWQNTTAKMKFAFIAKQQAKLALLTIKVCKRLVLGRPVTLDNPNTEILAGMPGNDFLAVFSLPLKNGTMFYNMALTVTPDTWMTSCIYEKFSSTPVSQTQMGEIYDCIAEGVKGISNIISTRMEAKHKIILLLPATNFALFCKVEEFTDDVRFTIVPDCHVDYYLGHVIYIIKYIVENVHAEFEVDGIWLKCASFVVDLFNTVWINPNFGKSPSQLTVLQTSALC